MVSIGAMVCFGLIAFRDLNNRQFLDMTLKSYRFSVGYYT